VFLMLGPTVLAATRKQLAAGNTRDYEALTPHTRARPADRTAPVTLSVYVLL
jgi:hypothetical protein